MSHRRVRIVNRAAYVLLAAFFALTVSGLPSLQTSAPTLNPSEVKGAPGPSSPGATRPGSYRVPVFPNGQGYAGEVEPNDTTATATPLAGTNLVVRANLFPSGDIDFFSFSATAGDRIYAATMTSFSAGNSTDSQLTLLASDGTTVIEFDDDNGTFAGLSSSIAGAVIPSSGTYFLKVNDFTAGTASERPYELHLRVQSGAPTPEAEPNDTPATANPLPASGWVSGTRNPAAATEQDWFSMTLAAGDTVYLSLDVDPEDDLVVWNGRLGIALFGDANNQILVVDDAGTGDVVPNPNRPSEALFMTVKTAGTFFAFVDSASAAVGGPTATYHLSVSVHPAVDEGVNCTTYTSTNVPQTIGPGTGLVSSTITVPGNPRIADLDVSITLNHALMQDIDAHLRSPAGNDNGLFTDIGAAATGGQTMMDVTFDDEAGIPPGFTVLRPIGLKPELSYRLSWFDGENAGGVWTLDLRDDTAGANGGTLTAWSLRICEAPPPPSCAPGFTPTTVFTTDFEGGAAGFTHSGTADEWELGLPATLATATANPIAAFNSCNSGTNCWKTDLDNTYNLSSTQDLLSPNVSLAGLSAPVVVTWAQRYQMENASFDHYNVNLREVGNPANTVRFFEFLDATMTDVPGNPTVNIGASAGWSVFSGRADALAGLNTELLFHLDSDNTVNFAGAAIDDVTVRACRPLSADLQITKTDGVTTAVPGQSVTYTITASNAGPDPVTGASVSDTFPASLTCSWTCVGAGGGTCTAGPVAGNIADSVNLPAGGSVTYTATCNINASATGSLSNTATVTASVTDPVPGNNSATDTDTLTPMADAQITKTDGVTNAVPGGSVTYTITASNPGPSNAPGSSVADTFPASLTCTWTCVGAGGGTCTGGPVAGNIADSVNLPAGGSVTYTANCTISASATGSLSNTATVTASVTDPVPGNNSATDTDTLTPMADAQITKTDGVTNAVPGGSVTYTIVASNPGPSNAPGSSVADTFPASLTCSWTCVGAGGGTCTAGPVAGNIADSVNLPAGGSVTYTANCTISAAATGTLVNTATVTAGVTDPVPGNNSATDTDTLANQADLQITKTDGVTTAVPGQSVTYTIVATNAGPANAPSSTVSDTFPGTLACTWTCASGGGASCTAGPAGGNISDSVNLPVGGTVSYTANCTIAASATGSLSNTATVSSAVTDPTPGNNSATDTDTLTPQADLAVTKTDGLTGASPGQATTYTIVASNAGPSNAPGTSVNDTFPAALTGVSWTCVGSLGGTCTAGPVAGNIADTANLPVGASVTYTVNATISGAFTGVLSNTATVAAGAGVTDPTPGNNSATDTTTVSSAANLSGTKDASGDFTEGGTIFYAVVISNSSATAQLDNPGDEFVDVLPAQLTLVDATATSGTATTTGNTVMWNGSVPGNGSVTITIEATINTGTVGQTISNQGTITFDADGNGTNETSVTTDDPGTTPGGDPTVFIVGVGGTVLDIPTLSQLGLGLLALLLAAGALWQLRRRG